MMDTRAAGQELQEQVLAAARKGHRRVTNTVKNVTATAQMIRPQLPTLPTSKITVKLPSRDELAKRTERQLSQLRKTAPALVARIPNGEHLAKLTEKQVEQLRKTAPGLIARLPSREHLMASASDLAGQMRSVQRQVTDQVRAVATPLAGQASSAFAQATGAAKNRMPVKTATDSAPTPVASHASETTPAKTTPAKTTAAGKSATTASAKSAKPASTRSTSTNTKKSKDAGK